MPINEALKDSIYKFLAWVEEHKVEFLTSEQPIFSRKYRYTYIIRFYLLY